MSATETDDLLERLLRDAATSSTPRSVQEAASDGGHPDDAQLAALEAGELSTEVARSLRRHVLFCDECAARTVRSGGEPDPTPPTPPRTRGAEAPPRDTGLQRRRLVFVAVIVAVAVASGFLVMESTRPVDDDRKEEPVTVAPGLDVRSVGVDGAGSPGVVHIEEPVIIELRDRRGDRPQYLYAMMVDREGRVHALATRREPRKVQGLVRFPASGPGYQIGELTEIRIGDSLVFLVVASSEPIPAFEGEVRDRVTLQRLTEIFKPLVPLAGEDPKALLAEFRKFGFGGVARAQVVRVQL